MSAQETKPLYNTLNAQLREQARRSEKNPIKLQLPSPRSALFTELQKVEKELTAASEGHNSGKLPTLAARRNVAKLVHRKLTIKEKLAV